MKLSLSTNWNNLRLESAAQIIDEALSMGFDSLELGFRTSESQAKEFIANSSRIKISSLHAFAPVPISAPCAHPELYYLADLDDEARKRAVLMMKRSIALAGELGASTIVVHAGRAQFSSVFSPLDSLRLKAILTSKQNDILNRAYTKALYLAKKRRQARAEKTYDAFRLSFSDLEETLNKCNVTLALENLPYLEGFPDESEMKRLLTEFKGAPLASWFDTGHHRVRQAHGWLKNSEDFSFDIPHRGIHLNDVHSIDDDHLQPGAGSVDFEALKNVMMKAEHVVFEPSSKVSRESLVSSLERIRAILG